MSAKDLDIRLALHPACRRYVSFKHTQYSYASPLPPSVYKAVVFATLGRVRCGQETAP